MVVWIPGKKKPRVKAKKKIFEKKHKKKDKLFFFKILINRIIIKYESDIKKIIIIWYFL